MRNQSKELLQKAYNQGWLSGFDFSILIQDLLISENGYVIDTGNWENVNAEVALRLAEKIKKHPLIWKLLFMVVQKGGNSKCEERESCPECGARMNLEEEK